MEVDSRDTLNEIVDMITGYVDQRTPRNTPQKASRPAPTSVTMPVTTPVTTPQRKLAFTPVGDKVRPEHIQSPTGVNASVWSKVESSGNFFELIRSVIQSSAEKDARVDVFATPTKATQHSNMYSVMLIRQILMDSGVLVLDGTVVALKDNSLAKEVSDIAASQRSTDPESRNELVARAITLIIEDSNKSVEDQLFAPDKLQGEDGKEDDVTEATFESQSAAAIVPSTITQTSPPSSPIRTPTRTRTRTQTQNQSDGASVSAVTLFHWLTKCVTKSGLHCI